MALGKGGAAPSMSGSPMGGSPAGAMGGSSPMSPLKPPQTTTGGVVGPPRGGAMGKGGAEAGRPMSTLPKVGGGMAGGSTRPMGF